MLPKPKFKNPETDSITIEQKYRKAEHREHVLMRSDTYVGSIEPQVEELWLYSHDPTDVNTNGIMNKVEATIIPGLYKIFDEILVNAIDQYTRMKRTIEQQALIIEGKLAPNIEINVKQTYRPVKNIRVTIDRASNCISVENDGTGIDVVIHQKEQIYVPELIFGHLLTSTNYEDQEAKTGQDKIWGGRNGYGAKLANIFSTRFEIETVDDQRQLHYHQVFTDNMKNIQAPVVHKYTKVPFTKITFYPDLKLFNIASLDCQTTDLMVRRVIDTAGWTDASVSVFLNGQKINIKNFEHYMNLYLPASKTDFKRVFYQTDRWEIGACLSSDQKFEQVSFVNGISTFRGGKHVDYIVNQITRKMLAQANKSAKNSTLKASHIKDNLWLFIKAIIPDPTFDTQTKENMTLQITKFGAQSKCELPDEFVAKIAKTGVLESAKKLNVFKDALDLTAKTDSSKKHHITVPKLDDAYWAGTWQSEKTTLVITEGDSAKTFAVDGIASLPEEERRFWGCWPIRGKFLNVREAKVTQLSSNAELITIMKILGLRHNADYSQSKADLRYGSLMILTDADTDGSHIGALIMNLFHYFWPSLLQRNDFLKALLTPIVRVWKVYRKTPNSRPIANPETIINFWTEAEYHKWKKEAEHLPDWKSWEIKYYKGLGTSDKKTATEIFQLQKLLEPQWEPANKPKAPLKLPKPIKIVTEQKEPVIDPLVGSPAVVDQIPVVGPTAVDQIPVVDQINNVGPIDPNLPDPNDDALTLAFAKNRADDRKVWIGEHILNQIYEYRNKPTYREFIDQRLRPFSVEDCARSIPCLCDGLKPSQRKVMYTVFNWHANKEIKVAQLAGSVANKSAYHHGEVSLHDTIVKLAQDYAGSNNINMLHPDGAFGSRINNGKDSASPRYIFTYLNNITKILFPAQDNPLYRYLDDDGFPVEPEWYLPIMPMILINGSIGIGTGYSTDIPAYNPLDVLMNLRRLLSNNSVEPMVPWYRGYKGTISAGAGTSFISRGLWSKLGPDRIVIEEVPLGYSYDNYKEYLENLANPAVATAAEKKETPTKKRENLISGLIRSIDCNNKGSDWFKPVISFVKDGLEKLESEIGVMKAFKLEETIHTSNMHLYNATGKITKYASPTEIILEYFPLRLEFYNKRRHFQLECLEFDLQKASAKLRFVLEVMDGTLSIHKKKRAEIEEQLIARNFPKLAKKSSKAEDTTTEEDDAVVDYNYLLHMHIESFSQETLEKLTKEKNHIEDQITWLKSKTPNDLWTQELDKFEESYKDFMEAWSELHSNIQVSAKAPTKLAVPKPKRQIKVV